MDFSSLTDDQLLQLLKGAIAEAISRGGAMKAAAEGEVLSAKERAQIEFQVAENLRLQREEEERQRVAKEAEARLREAELAKKAETVESTWAVKAAAVEAIRRWGYKGTFHLTIWQREEDRRVYFQETKYGGKRDWKWTLYLTGNRYHPPGDFEGAGPGSWFDDKVESLERFLYEVTKSWKTTVDIPDTTGKVQPAPSHLKRYLKAIGIEEETNVESN